MGFFEKFRKKKTPPVPAAEPPKHEAKQEPEIKKRTSWIDQLHDPNSGVHEALAKLADNPKPKEPEVPVFNVSVTVRHEYVEDTKDEPVSKLSVLDFGKPVGVLGCFLNYEPRVLEPPTKRQLEYAKDLGVFVPDGVTKQDISCLISRALGEDSKESPKPEIVALAAGLGTQYSACIGANGLIAQIIHDASDKDKAALYVYGVRQSLRGASFGNMLADQGAKHFYEFSDHVLADPALLRSLQGRAVSDFLCPRKGTNIFKAAAAFLTGDTP